MSVEEDIGGLKADMSTVRGQTSKIFDKMDSLTEHVIEHTTKTTGRLANLEERDTEVKDTVKGVEGRVEDLEQSRTKAKWYLLGVGGGGAIGGASLIEILKATFKGVW